ncbi:MAG TPA: TA system VapC family ribonuclease toxin [Bryobacteraceae bacterium]|nr:TA system VapC family ribonuclease toxin [Bryobacteraceae bacterium]
MKKGHSKPLLLDVNVLFALAWPNHQFHTASVRRLESSNSRWATCALTQLSFIRLSSNPAAVPSPKSPAEAALVLASMTRDDLHIYFGTMPSPSASPEMFHRILGAKQVTDIYLLALAQLNNAVFVTFDTKLRGLAAAETEVEVLGL